MNQNLSIEQHQVPQQVEKARLQDYAVGKFEALPSRKGTKKAIERGRVLVNGKPGATATWIEGGERLELLPALARQLPDLDLGLKVLWEDEHLAMVCKPAGILTNGNRKFTLENGLTQALKPSAAHNSLPRPLTVHRLDYPTSGAVLIAKTRAALIRLKRQFEERKIGKTYLAVAAGDTTLNERLNSPVDGKAAETDLNSLESLKSEKYGKLSLLQLHPRTGRRHQLRVQLAQAGCPILGDPDYHLPGLRSYGNGLYLHAWELKLQHPITEKPLMVRAPIPFKFRRLFETSIAKLEEKKA